MQKERLTTHSLVPERALLTPLASHLQARFAQALTQMHSNLGEKLTWQQIAQRSAISPAHFHRQFRALFHETPGNYLSRYRLQKAVEYLLGEPEVSVTEVAHQCGFSSSQALGKALKRELGETAKAIQNIALKGTPSQTSALLSKLAQPSPNGPLELLLAREIPAELVWMPQRSGKLIAVKSTDWEYLLDRYGDCTSKYMLLTPVNQLERIWQKIEDKLCDWQCHKSEHDFFIPEGHYLSADVTVSQANGYLAAIESMFHIAEQLGLAVDKQGYLIEQVLSASEAEGLRFTIQIPIISLSA